MKVGLTLGKFAPLHRGHQKVIEASLAEMEHTVVLIYDCPDVDLCPLPVRSQWIRDLYPTVEVLEAWDAPLETGLDPAITAKHDTYLRQRFRDRRITHFYSSEAYGEHVSKALGAVDRRVDMERKVIPISGTEIRKDPFRHRESLHPQVYRDLVTRVVFLGAPSTGKTTMAKRLAEEYATVWLPEYGREYWELHQTNRRLSPAQLLDIAVEHSRREEAMIAQANRYLFLDTDATTTYQFSHYYHDYALPELARMAEVARHRNDIVFLCGVDIPYEDTWDRSGDVSRLTMQRRIESDLLARKVPFIRLVGSLEERTQQVKGLLEKYGKYANATIR